MKRERLYIILALVTICFWGTTFVSTKILLGVLSPIHIMLLRYVIAYVSLLAIHPKIHRPESLSLELRYVAAALFGSTLYFLAENFALSFTQAANVSLLISAAPILTSVVAHLTTRDEHLTRNAVGGFFCRHDWDCARCLQRQLCAQIIAKGRPARGRRRALLGVLFCDSARYPLQLPACIRHAAHLFLFHFDDAAMSAV